MCNEGNSNNADNRAYEIKKTLLQENLTHARHVETERLTFTSICSVFLASSSTLILLNAELRLLFSFPLLLLLLLVSFICRRLTLRWNEMFNTHYLAAKYILCELSPALKKEYENTETKFHYYAFVNEPNKSSTRTLFLKYDSLLSGYIIFVLIVKLYKSSAVNFYILTQLTQYIEIAGIVIIAIIFIIAIIAIIVFLGMFIFKSSNYEELEEAAKGKFNSYSNQSNQQEK